MINNIVQNLIQERLIFSVLFFTPIILIIFYEIITYCWGNQLESKIDKNLISYPQENLSFVNFWLPTIFFSIFFLIYTFLIFYKEDFAYYDNEQFTKFSLQGIAYGFPIWRDQGRFWPLGLQEYNLLSLIDKSQLVYRGFSIVQLLIISFSLYFTLYKFSPIWRYITIFIIFICPPFLMTFFELIYPERNVVFYLIILILIYTYHTKNYPKNKRFFIYSALITAQIAIYYKEPVFVLIATIASARLFITLLSKRYLHLKKILKELIYINYIDIGMIVLTLTYCLLYQTQIVPYIIDAYSHNQKTEENTIFSIFLLFIQDNFIIGIFSIILVLRLLQIIFLKSDIDVFLDPLALGGMAYLGVYAKLKMFDDYNNYYFAPALVIAIIYIAHFIYNSIQFSQQINRKVLRKIYFYSIVFLSSIILILTISQYISQSSYKILSRKAVINGHVNLVNGLVEYSEKNNRDALILFFPLNNSFIHNYLIYTFKEFLSYKKFHIFNVNKNDNYTNNLNNFKNISVILKSPATDKHKDNKCISWDWAKDEFCFFAEKAETGDLIVLLPNYPRDSYNPEEIKKMIENEKLVFAYDFNANAPLIEKILHTLSHKKVENGKVYIFEKL
ncbi:hypothetical protein ACN4EE_13425 [Geminocystis sp. CENA526]|uniref:hypothetical protein n=1 Tax=Geminocystis sp. CENA526 TaxID=1355871 RepID=UPI003D6E070A